MPAIQLAHLKRQCVELANAFDAPQDFMRQLHTLLDFYADRTRRPGQAGKPPPLIRAYQAPRQVLRLLEQELLPHIQADPVATQVLMDLLWEAAWLETRLLAIALLGHYPQQATALVLERARVWSLDGRDELVLTALFEHGLAPLRRFAPQAYLDLLDEWLSASDQTTWQVALQAIPPLVREPHFENLPYIYRLLSPHLREPGLRLEAQLLAALRSLVKRSPQETAFFLQQQIMGSRNPLTRRLIRQSLSAFPAGLAKELQGILREDRLRGLVEN